MEKDIKDLKAHFQDIFECFKVTNQSYGQDCATWIVAGDVSFVDLRLSNAI